MNRQSNIELLRIIAMIMVMILHVNYTSLGVITKDELISTPISGFFRLFFESLCIGSVDTFVLISGWFGIKFSKKSLESFIFQCIFFSWGIYFLFVIIGWTNFSLSSLTTSLFVKNQWFVLSYLGLFILSPALNALVNTNRQKHLQVLSGLFLLELIYDFLSKDTTMFNSGYSVLHFLFLYLLARYVRLYGEEYTYYRKSGYIFILIISFISLAQFLIIKNCNLPIMRLCTYTSPAIILAAICLVITFSKLKIESRIINTTASGCFAVYLFHTHPLILIHYTNWAREIYLTNSNWVYLYKISFFIIIWFIIAVLLDFIRRMFWGKICNTVKITKYESKKLN